MPQILRQRPAWAKSFTERAKQGYQRHPVAGLALVVTTIYVLCGVGLGFYTTRIIPSNQALLAHYPREQHNHLNALAEWDSVFYLGIAEHGYADKTSAAFFPLYPMLIRSLRPVTGSYLTTAILISWLCLLGATYFYLRIIERIWGNQKPNQLLTYLLLFLFFPTGIFLLAAYTESLFALLSLAAIYCALTSRLGWMTLCGALAAVTRLNGLFILVLAFGLLLEQRVALRRLVPYGLLSLVPFGLFLLFLKRHYGSFLAFLSAEKSWQRFGSSYLTTMAHTLNALSLLGFLALIVTVVYWLRHRRWSFAGYSALYLLAPLISGNFDGLNRYMLLAFPLHWMVISEVRRRQWLVSPLLTGSAALWAYFVVQYFGGYTGG